VVAWRNALIMHRRKFSRITMGEIWRRCASMSPKMNTMGASHGERIGHAVARADDALRVHGVPLELDRS